MGKVNFTKDHLARLKELSTEMLFNNSGIHTQFGVANAVEILHTTTVQSLNALYRSLSKNIKDIEDGNQWTATDYELKRLAELKAQQEFVNLVIGYKLYNDELKELNKKKTEIEKQIADLEAAEKTPADRLKELKDVLAELNGDNEN